MEFSFFLGLLGRWISPPQGLYLHTGQHNGNKHTQTSMPGVGFEPMTPVFGRAKTVHAFDGTAIVVGRTTHQSTVVHDCKGYSNSRR
jgi:hypothetical protein